MSEKKIEKSVIENQVSEVTYKASYDLSLEELKSMPKALISVVKQERKKKEPLYTFNGQIGSYHINVDKRVYLNINEYNSILLKNGIDLINPPKLITKKCPYRFVESIDTNGNNCYRLQLWLTRDLIKTYFISEVTKNYLNQLKKSKLIEFEWIKMPYNKVDFASDENESEF